MISIQKLLAMGFSKQTADALDTYNGAAKDEQIEDSIFGQVILSYNSIKNQKDEYTAVKLLGAIQNRDEIGKIIFKDIFKIFGNTKIGQQYKENTNEKICRDAKEYLDEHGSLEGFCISYTPLGIEDIRWEKETIDVLRVGKPKEKAQKEKKEGIINCAYLKIEWADGYKYTKKISWL